VTGLGAPWQTDPLRAVEEATSLPDQLPGYARHPRESLSRPTLDRHLIDICARAFARLVSTPAQGGVIAVTSPNREEGRSTVAAALAIGIARDTDRDTLLLDLDFERPQQADLFRVAASPGLADFVEGKAKLRLIAGSSGRRLWLGPAGRSNSEPTRLCHDLIETGLMAQLRDRFGWIVLDLPPLPEPAAQVSAGLADFYLFLGRHRSTTHSALKRMLSLAGGDRPAGFLLTGDQSRIPSWIKRLL
jgi:Mrp family chromosome partitioning ATPase